MFSLRELSIVAGLLREAARREIMPRFRRLGAGDVRVKSGVLDLVTEADEAAELLIAHGLSQAFPGCLVVGEEASAADPSLLDRLAGAALAFTVDPVDGTSNYAAGLPLFGVMAGVVVHGAVVGAVILDPVVDSFSAALLGGGAWEEAADGSVRALRVAAPVDVGAMTGMVSWRFMAPDVRARVLGGLTRFAQNWDFRCAAQHYRMLASGHGHFAVYNRLMPWDHLPGVLLHTEAGGYAARFDGGAYLPGMVDGGLICAPDLSGFLGVRDALLCED
jgi:fructose-1,6-bisphosphatase/inositol monophosphatase family enzyme